MKRERGDQVKIGYKKLMVNERTFIWKEQGRNKGGERENYRRRDGKRSKKTKKKKATDEDRLKNEVWINAERRNKGKLRK